MMTRITASLFVLLAYGMSTAMACSGCGCTAQTAPSCSQAKPAQLADIVHAAEHAGQFTTLLTALEVAGLEDALRGPGPFTVFAPTDDAFAALPKGTVESLLKEENRAKLQSILKYHVVPGAVMSSDLMKYTNAKTLHGNKLSLTLRVNNARVTTADVKARNGVIHVIDRVILPDNAKPITGHANSEAPKRLEKDIVETAVDAGQFKTLVAAIQAAGLADALSGEGPFTVFAPTDAAFAKLPKGTVEMLVKPENRAKLQAILKYHVLPARLGSNDIVAAHTVKTLNGQAIYPSLMVDNAALQAKNIYCHNGVIHVIDSVIVPEEKS